MRGLRSRVAARARAAGPSVVVIAVASWGLTGCGTATSAPATATVPADTVVVAAATLREPPRMRSCPPFNVPNPDGRRGADTVVVEAVIGFDGRVETGTVRVVRATDPLFQAGAVAVTANCRFRPGSIDGRPARVLVQFPLFIRWDQGRPTRS